MINLAIGDATIIQKFQVIAHVVNDVGKWGAGFSGVLEKRYPGLGADYRRRLAELVAGREPVLGRCLVTRLTNVSNVCVVHMIAQHGVRSKENPKPINYDALRLCLRRLGTDAQKGRVASIQMPKIGAGLAGGDWSIILPIIISELENLPIPVTIYELGQ